MLDLEKLSTNVCDLVKETGSFIRNEQKNFSLASVEYKGSNDLVSYVDKTAEKMLVAGLEKLLAGSGFITEEKTNTTTGIEYNWIIDPLDGTTNFVHGLTCFCVSVGLKQHDKIILGVIYEVNLDECFYAF